ncbi:MAG: insulinase family protein [Bdellovibrionales bacterium]|nr:insulinase family protein [Bdellovibrionales bacterium]
MPHSGKITIRTGFGILFALALLTGCQGRSRGGSFGGVKIEVDERKLSNGLTVLMAEKGTAPVVTFQTWIRAGSVDEPRGKTGMAHLFEHLMFKGTEKYPEKEFFNQLEARGAEVNAYTVRDYTVYYETFTPDLLGKVIEMEADRFENFKLTPALLDTERLVVFEERRLRTDNSPSGRMNEALWKLAFRSHPYRWPVIGEPQDLAGLRAEDLQAFFKEHYQPGNAVIVVAGAIDRDHTFKLIEKAYGRIKGRKARARKIPDEAPQESEQRYVMRDHVAGERFMHAYRVTAASNPESYALDVFAQIVFAGASSRAYRALVEEKEVALGVSGSAYTPTFPGLFVISTTMKGNRPASEGESLLEEVIEQVRAKGVTEEERSAAVKQLTVNLLDDVRTPYGLGELIGTVMMVLGDPTQINRDLEKYRRVTLEEVRSAAKKYLHPNNRSVVTLLPEEPSGKADAAPPAALEGGGA